MWLMSTPGVGIRASTSSAGAPTTGRVSSRNFSPIGGADPPWLTAATMSRSGAEAPGFCLVLALCVLPDPLWPAPGDELCDPQPQASSDSTAINSGLYPLLIARRDIITNPPPGRAAAAARRAAHIAGPDPPHSPPRSATDRPTQRRAERPDPASAQRSTRRNSTCGQRAAVRSAGAPDARAYRTAHSPPC